MQRHTKEYAPESVTAQLTENAVKKALNAHV
jgi:hypothetical protein